MSQRTLPLLDRPGAGMILALVLGTTGGVRAQDEAERAGRLGLVDSRTQRPRRIIHDVEHIDIVATKGHLRATLRFRTELARGTFTCVHMFADTDRNDETGIGGADVWVRAAVGSRFRPNYATVEPGVPGRLLLRATTLSRPSRLARVGLGASAARQWSHGPELGTPRVAGRTLGFEVPLALLLGRKGGYRRSIRLYFDVEGSCSEPPLTATYTMEGTGTAATIDGSDSEWTHGASVVAVDERGELHPDTAEVDITSMAVSHHRSDLLVLVRFARAGFRAREAWGGRRVDIRDEEVVHIGVEPIGEGRYMKYREFAVHAHRAFRGPGSPQWALGERIVEARVPCATEQKRFRVHVWADARRHDRIPDRGWADLTIPSAAWNPHK